MNIVILSLNKNQDKRIMQIYEEVNQYDQLKF